MHSCKNICTEVALISGFICIFAMYVVDLPDLYRGTLFGNSFGIPGRLFATIFNPFGAAQQFLML